jgi:hypothetical protein
VSPLAKIAAALTALLVLALAPAADARRTVPSQFMGMNWDGPVALAPEQVQSSQFARMGAAGVEAVRTTFQWSTAQPDDHGPIDLGPTDTFVGMAAAHRIEVLPIVTVAPPWARIVDAPQSAPANPPDMVPFVQALVHRYGAGGSFWTDHPELPKVPIRYWQFWNEPHLFFQWTLPPRQAGNWPGTYAAALAVFHDAVKAADPRAKVVLAGLSNQSPSYLTTLYKRGIRPNFDVVAIHPYTGTAAHVVELARRIRVVMKHYGDARKPLWLTELGLPSSRGRVNSKNTLQTTPRGMARFLTGSYKSLARTRRNPAIGVSRAFWYTWASEYSGDIFRYTGLFRYDGTGSAGAQLAFGAYVQVARLLEGCTKASSGSCR